MTVPADGDEYTSYDAAYVLGALTPEERRRYEQHLSGCARCRQAVDGVAGLPGLLSRVPMAELDTPPVQPPPELLDTLLAAAAARRRRTRLLISAGGAVAAAICLVLALLLANGPTATPTPPARAMTAVTAAPLRATVALRAEKWGTDVTLHCTYAGSVTYSQGYTLVVVDTDGKVDQISTWAAVPRTTTVLTGTTAVPTDRIRAVEVRTASGTPLLSLSP